MNRNRYTFLLIFILSLAIFIGCSESSYDAPINSAKDLSGKKIITWINGKYDEFVLNAVDNPEIIAMDSLTDSVLSLSQGKAGAIAGSKSYYNYYIQRTENFSIIDQPIGELDIAFIFSETGENPGLKEDFNNYLSEIKKNGVYEGLIEKWLNNNPDEEHIDFSGLENNSEVLRVGFSSIPPLVYNENDEFKGFEPDLLVGFCREYGKNLKIVQNDDYGITAAAQLGDLDICVSDFAINEYLGGNLSYSNPVYRDQVVLVTYKDVANKSFADKVSDSFEKSFMEEGRYIEYAKGLLVTIELTFPSIIIGLIIGFLLYFLRMTEKKAAIWVIKILCLIRERIPDLVLLMIFYFVIFASANSNPIMIAIIAFSYIFSITTYNNIYDISSKVDAGQSMAAMALGYTKMETFGLVIFPQIRNELLSRFKGDFVTHMLQTSIVGLLSITDLTGTGNYIRSLTFESFAPLAIVSILYFIVASVVFVIIDIIQRKIDPRNRTKEKILEGIDTGKSRT